MEDTTEQLKSLNKAVAELSATTKRLYSYKSIFVRGIISGVGTFLGATIIAAIAITVLVQVLKLFDIDLGINGYLESLIPKQ